MKRTLFLLAAALLGISALAQPTLKSKDGTQSVIETPFSFGTRTEIKAVNGPVPEQTQAK